MSLQNCFESLRKPIRLFMLEVEAWRTVDKYDIHVLHSGSIKVISKSLDFRFICE